MMLKVTLPYTGAYIFNSEDKFSDLFNILANTTTEDIDNMHVELVDDIEYSESSYVEVDENARLLNNDTAVLEYDIPYNVALKQRFQSRIYKDIPEIIENLYPGLYTILDVSYSVDTPKNIKLKVKFKANTQDAVGNIAYVEDNIAYIVEDIINYYQNR